MALLNAILDAFQHSITLQVAVALCAILVVSFACCEASSEYTFQS